MITFMLVSLPLAYFLVASSHSHLIALSTVAASYILIWSFYLGRSQEDNPRRPIFFGVRLPYLPYHPYRIAKLVCAVLGQVDFTLTKLLPIGVKWGGYTLWQRFSSGLPEPRIHHNIDFGSHNPACLLDVYCTDIGHRLRKWRDVRGSRNHLRPVIVFVYGGGWSSGEKGTYALLAQTLQDYGFVVVVPDYSIYPAGKIEHMISDMRRVIFWTHKHIADYDGNPSEIYLMGHSAGAHLVSLTVIHDAISFLVGRRFARSNKKRDVSNSTFFPGISPLPFANERLPHIHGLILVAGVYDIVSHFGFESGRGVEEVSAMARVMGGTPEAYQEVSPSTLLKGYGKLFRMGNNIALLPHNVMLVHSPKDGTVPLKSSETFYAVLKEVGIPNVSMHVYGLDHAGAILELMLPLSPFSSNLLILVRAFVQRSGLSDPPTPPSPSESGSSALDGDDVDTRTVMRILSSLEAMQFS
ncbi:Alpha/Beta hydrolase protein [Cladochytrium replicatum]|nr:Alpha/Beta hydrolase protein [Cladochytrium replicatum]